jgi:hypothetical protein
MTGKRRLEEQLGALEQLRRQREQQKLGGLA